MNKKVAAILVLGIFCVVYFFKEELWNNTSELAVPCHTDGNAILQIDDHLFSVPNGLRGAHLDGQTFPKNRSLDRICPSTDGKPIKAQGFSVQTPSPKERQGNDPDFSAEISVRFKAEGATDLIVTDYISKNSKKLGAFLVNDVNYPGTGEMANSTIFISTNDSFKTPNDHPVTIGCYHGDGPRGRECYTWFAWADKISVEYRFYDGDYDSTQWEELYQKILAFMADLDVTNKTN